MQLAKASGYHRRGLPQKEPGDRYVNSMTRVKLSCWQILAVAKLHKLLCSAAPCLSSDKGSISLDMQGLTIQCQSKRCGHCTTRLLYPRLNRMLNGADLVGAASRNKDTIPRPLLKMPWLHSILLLQLYQVLGTQIEFLQHANIHIQTMLQHKQEPTAAVQAPSFLAAN